MTLLLSLIVVAVLATTQSDHDLIGVGVVPVLVALIATQVDRDGARISEWLVRFAARMVPARDRTELLAEWTDHTRAAGEAGLRPITRALSITLIAAPALAIGLRVGRARGDRGKARRK